MSISRFNSCTLLDIDSVLGPFKDQREYRKYQENKQNRRCFHLCIWFCGWISFIQRISSTHSLVLFDSSCNLFSYDMPRTNWHGHEFMFARWSFGGLVFFPAFPLLSFLLLSWHGKGISIDLCTRRSVHTYTGSNVNAYFNMINKPMLQPMYFHDISTM